MPEERSGRKAPDRFVSFDYCCDLLVYHYHDARDGGGERHLGINWQTREGLPTHAGNR